ncbi:unnamed protein product [Caenorhabditis auriculariae]|uniref:Uncharacterized protein n=1 Tax=Caenorhabditis auriculariae TaxID=2777116 RepID=A0A8S1HT93_9PELO|nr:unnamed protein product [Caenorhabditis auriculariae]
MTLAQALPDFLISATYIPLYIARYFQFGNEFYFKYQEYYLPSWVKNHGSLLIIMKAFGVGVISYQRYLTLCRPHSWLNKQVKESPPWRILLVLWGLPVLVCTPVWTNNSARFLDPITLGLTSSASWTKVIPDFAIVATYSVLWIARFFHIGNEFIFKYQDFFFANYMMIHATVLLIMKAFAVTAIAFQRYLALCCHTSWLHQPDLNAAYLFSNYALILSNFAFINPWTLLILNTDVRRNLFGSLAGTFVYNSQLSSESRILLKLVGEMLRNSKSENPSEQAEEAVEANEFF